MACESPDDGDADIDEGSDSDEPIETPGDDSDDGSDDGSPEVDDTDVQIGSHLIGELEGPVVVDEIPTSFNESPDLAARVEAGELPPIEERIGGQPLVIQPVHEIGQYGGNWRRAFTGPSDVENMNRVMSSDRLLFRDYIGEDIVPMLALDWELTDDGRVTTLYLREGLHWSDGQPFTAADFEFWWEHLYDNEEIVGVKSTETAIDGQQGILETEGDYIVRYVFPEPYPFFPQVLASHTHVGNGHTGSGHRFTALYAPGHYLQQFHPAFIGQDEADSLASAAGYDNWVNYLSFLNSYQLNTDLPVMSPWKTAVPINNPQWVLERNPFFYAVDTEGNQLPYFDTVTLTNAEEQEVITLRAIAGELDWQGRHIALAALPVLLENQETGDYTVRLDPGNYGTDALFHFNNSYQGDPEIQKWITNREFRRAFSLGIDREQLNEALWLGIGTPGSAAPGDDSPESPGPEYRTLWSTYEPELANEMLDSIGLQERDSEGYRLRTDNGERLRLQVNAVGAGAVDWPSIAEMMSFQLGESIGIQLELNELERGLAEERVMANDYIMHVNAGNAGSDKLFLWPHDVLPLRRDTTARMGPELGHWFATQGEEGVEPPEEMKEAFRLYSDGLATADESERVGLAQEIWKIMIEEQYSIATVGLSPAYFGVRVVRNNIGNSPSRQGNGHHFRTPGSTHPPTFFYKS